MSTYIKVVRNIWSGHAPTLIHAKNKAFDSGYKALVWNGEIYCMDCNTGDWCRTVFNISDFEV